MRGFVGLVSRGNVVQGSWVSLSRDDECMDNKIYSESFTENILPTKNLYDRDQSQVRFFKPSSSLQLNWDMKCILIG